MERAQATSEPTAVGMSVLDAIYGRRSVRSYLPQPLDRATIQALLKAAVRAPTAIQIHEEPWVFAIIQDSATRKRLSDMAKPLFVAEMQRAHVEQGTPIIGVFERPEFNIFYNASTLVVICTRQTNHLADPDCWLAAENLLLAAHAAGLGTCLVTSALPALNSPAGQAELGIPSDVLAVVPIILGVPDGMPPPTPRREPRVIVWK